MISTTKDSDGIVTVTIDQSDRSVNVIDTDLVPALVAAFDAIAVQDDVRGVILTSAKSSFIAGADLERIKTYARPGMTPADAAGFAKPVGDMVRRIERLGKPVVAAAPGTALGGGLEVMLGCHYRISADVPKALFGLPEVTLGLLPGAGGTQRLPRLIGLPEGLRLLTGDLRLGPAEALAVGILDEVVPAEVMLDAARRALLDGRVASVPRWETPGFVAAGPAIGALEALNLFLFTNAALAADPGPAYPAASVIASCVWEGMRLPLDKALEVERKYFGHLATGAAAHALLEVRFFARQRLAKRGLRAVPADHPAVALCQAAIRAEAERMAGQGLSANVVNNAAIRFDLLPPLPPSASSPEECADLAVIARRLLLAGAVAVAGIGREDADLVNLAAIDHAGFPAWTGGPLGLIDAAGAGAIVEEAAEAGLPAAPALAGMAATDVRFFPGEAG